MEYGRQGNYKGKYQNGRRHSKKVIDLVAKAHNVSSNDFYEVYKKEYEAFYKDRIKKEN